MLGTATPWLPEDAPPGLQLPTVASAVPWPSALAALPGGVEGYSRTPRIDDFYAWERAAPRVVERNDSKRPGYAHGRARANPAPAEHVVIDKGESQVPTTLPLRSHRGNVSETRTTLVVRHMPVRSTVQNMLEAIESSGFNGTFAYLFFPMKADGRKNKGFALVTFYDCRHARAFQSLLDGARLRNVSGKSIEVKALGKYQPLDEVVAQGDVCCLYNSSCFGPVVLSRDLDPAAPSHFSF